jgi:dTDP-3-amino-2,3,6-trideoxy-4-keto-D-glucose/dTDP-3-amino-3,4,6-trideoxy-alpha-D-glucose/dTDP-2,6-dideoxy-D-kanosamine transaminase
MIKPFDYQKILEPIEPEVMEAIRGVLHSGYLILGPETQAFEKEFAAWLGAPHCVGVASGTSALHIALWALDVRPGDEVITVANTCPPTISALRLTGAVPRFVDVAPDTLLATPESIEAAITPKTRCIIVVHLWGSMVDMEAVMALARKAGVAVVEDCAQAVGADWKGRKAGTWGDVGCFSFYPTKNLGAYGDAGAVATENAELAARMRRVRMYGYEAAGVSLEEGMNVRIHEVQAAILRVKLRYLNGWLERRKAFAAQYDRLLDNPLAVPVARNAGGEHAFHQYVVRSSQRDALGDWLRQHEIGFGIHYGTPVHQMPAYLQFAGAGLPHTERGCREVLSLPLHEALTQEEVETVAGVVNDFRG